MHYVKSRLCQLPNLKLSCMGCCGHHFSDKVTLAKDIEKNTIEYSRVHQECIKCKHHAPKVDWIKQSKDLRASGVCRNLVYDVGKDMLGCPLHPEQNDGDDLRKEHLHCDTLYVCKTAFMFDLWDGSRQKAFLKFLKKKGLDWHSYSLGMAGDELLDEFEGLDWEAKR